MDRRIAGYIHADFLIEDIAGDKTSLRRSSSRWKLLSGGASKQLSKFMKEIGAIREEKLPQKMIKSSRKVVIYASKRAEIKFRTFSFSSGADS